MTAARPLQLCRLCTNPLKASSRMTKAADPAAVFCASAASIDICDNVINSLFAWFKFHEFHHLEKEAWASEGFTLASPANDNSVLSETKTDREPR